MLESNTCSSSLLLNLTRPDHPCKWIKHVDTQLSTLVFYLKCPVILNLIQIWSTDLNLKTDWWHPVVTASQPPPTSLTLLRPLGSSEASGSAYMICCCGDITSPVHFIQVIPVSGLSVPQPPEFPQHVSVTDWLQTTVFIILLFKWQGGRAGGRLL